VEGSVKSGAVSPTLSVEEACPRSADAKDAAKTARLRNRIDVE
jgi:hypothetical protein